ncbi:hypothetical protein BH11BAC2_BH11BAC2_19700 [soil metagenome]
MNSAREKNHHSSKFHTELKCFFFVELLINTIHPAFMKTTLQKLKLLSSLSLLLLTFQSQAQWRWLHPSPQGNDLHKICFIGPNTGWAAGDRSALIKTTNGGTSWTQQYTGFFDDIRGIYFSTANNGCVSGGQNFNVTSDGGATWTTRYRFPDIVIKDMFFLNADTGFVCGDYGGIYQLYGTNDAGLTWTPRIAGIVAELNDIQVRNNGAGWAVGDQGSLYTTVDFGQNWTSNSIAGNPILQSVNFFNTTTGYAVGEAGVIFKSVDGGINWNALSNPGGGSSINYYSVLFSSADTGIVGGTDGFNLRTVDGGVNWSVIGQPGWFKGFDIDAGNSQTIYMAAANGEVIKSTDGGNSWSSQIQRISETILHGVSAASAQNIFAAGDFGTILKSGNAGTTWAVQTTPVFDNFYDIAFINGTTGVAVGDFGQMVRTTNGGTVWNTVTSPVTDNLNAICKASSTTLYAVGLNDAVIKSTNSGQSFSNVITPLSGLGFGNTDVFFIAADTGWVCTDGSEIMYTTDGGVNWGISSIPSIGPITGISFTDASNGWACTYNGEILNTNDGGQNWNSVYVSNAGTFHKIVFADSQNGWVFGDGRILRTADAGLNWSDEFSSASIIMNDAAVITNTSLIAVGEGTSSILGRSGDLRLNVVQTTLCTDNNYNVTVNVTGTFNPGNLFEVQISDEYGSFEFFPLTVGQTAGTGSTVVFVTIPNGLIDGNIYRMRVVANNPPNFSPVNDVPLTVHTSPNAYAIAGGPTAFCVGDSVTIYAITSPGWTYQWYKDGILMVGATVDSITVGLTGNYTVKVDDGVCNLTSPIVDVVALVCSSIEEVAASSFKAYPNPTTGTITVDWKEGIHVDQATLSDLSGRVILVQSNHDPRQMNLDLSELPKGIYMLTLNGERKVSIKLVKL